MYKKYWPDLYSNLQYAMGQDVLDIHYYTREDLLKYCLDFFNFQLYWYNPGWKILLLSVKIVKKNKYFQLKCNWSTFFTSGIDLEIVQIPRIQYCLYLFRAFFKGEHIFFIYRNNFSAKILHIVREAAIKKKSL